MSILDKYYLLRHRMKTCSRISMAARLTTNKQSFPYKRPRPIDNLKHPKREDIFKKLKHKPENILRIWLDSFKFNDERTG